MSLPTVSEGTLPGSLFPQSTRPDPQHHTPATGGERLGALVLAAALLGLDGDAVRVECATGGWPPRLCPGRRLHSSQPGPQFGRTRVWRASPPEFSSVASSLAWPLQLAGCMLVVGPQEWLPLALNLVYGLLADARHRLGSAAAGQPSCARDSAGVVLVVVLTSLPLLVLIGMEHLLHAVRRPGFRALLANVLAQEQPSKTPNEEEQRQQRQHRKQHDIILIDCPPALGLLTINGLVAADWAMISSEAQYFALQGVQGALEVTEQAKEFYNPDLEWLGVVLNIADMRTVHSRTRSSAQGALRRQGVRHRDPRLDRLCGVGRAGRSILDHRPDLGADYLELADEILARIGLDAPRRELKPLLDGGIASRHVRALRLERARAARAPSRRPPRASSRCNTAPVAS